MGDIKSIQQVQAEMPSSAIGTQRVRIQVEVGTISIAGGAEGTALKYRAFDSAFNAVPVCSVQVGSQETHIAGSAISVELARLLVGSVGIRFSGYTRGTMNLRYTAIGPR